MIHLLKKSVAAAAAVLACAGAHADVVDWGAHNLPPFGEKAAAFPLNNGVPFADTYTFTVGTDSIVTSVVSANNNLPAYAIDLGAYGLFTSGGVALFTESFSGATGSVQNSWSIAAGSYYYKVIGTASGTDGGLYTITSNVAAVPEPETYALLLGGLGVVGFVAARRRVGA
jgi:hypothetical protein